MISRLVLWKCDPYNIFKILNILEKSKPSMPELNPTANIFKALMHPSRLMILEILRDGEQCVCHLEAVLGCRQAYISQHLMVLREAGLVDDRREGARIYYRVIKPEVYALVDSASTLSGSSHIELKSDKPSDCPCPKCNPGVEGKTEKVSETYA